MGREILINGEKIKIYSPGGDLVDEIQDKELQETIINDSMREMS